MKKRLLTVALIFVFAICIVSLTACSAAEQYFVFGTSLDISAKGTGSSKYIKSVVSWLEDTEQYVSAIMEDSDIWRLNRAAAGETVVCNPVTIEILQSAHRVYELTDGAYDPTVYPLVELWGFSPDKFVGNVAPDRLPTDAEISEMLGLVGFDEAFAIDAENNSVTKLKEGAKLDLGGVAKGYAVQKALSMAGKTEALVNLGGNIGAANASYTIGIGAPREYDKSYIGTVGLSAGQCISTSGDYEKYYFVDGVRYHHIINPATGRPADSGLVSVTVITPDGALGDALATAIMVAGAEKGTLWANELGVGCIMVSVDADGNMQVSAVNVDYKSA